MIQPRAPLKKDHLNKEDRIDPAVWKISSVVLLGPLMTNLDSTVVNVSLSALGRDLHAPLTQIQWVASGYLLALALMLPLSGWLVDRLGAKRVYVTCFSLFTAASLLCGLATSAGALVAFRIGQGMVGGLMAPMAQMMTARIAGRHVARVMGFIIVPVLIGPIFGPVLAGVILQHSSWRWIFLINIPIGLLATALAVYVLPRDAQETQPRTFDMTGFLLLSPCLVLLLYSLESLSAASPAKSLSIAELLAACLLLALFLRHAGQLGESALLDIGLFRRPTFAAAALLQFLLNAATFGGQMLLPLYLLLVIGRSPSSAGLLLAFLGLGTLCASPLSGTLTDRFGLRAVSVSGALLALIGTLPFAFFGMSVLSAPLLCTALFVRGIGLGAIYAPSIAAAYSAIPKTMIPAATTSFNIVQRLGGPAAVTLLVIALHQNMQRQAGDMPKAFAATFWLLCAIHLGGIFTAFRLPHLKKAVS